MPPKKATKSGTPSVFKKTKQPEKPKKTKQPEKPKQPKQPEKPEHVTFPLVDPRIGRSASINGPYYRGYYGPISQITREELEELEVPVKKHPYKDNYVETPELNAYRTTTIEEANSHLGPSDPTMRSDTDEINKQKMERNKQLYRDRDYNDFLAQQEKLREEQGPTDSLLRQTAMTGPSSNFDDTYTSGPTDYSQYPGLPFGRSNTESGNFGGKRRTKKSRKSRKARKTRKVRKVRKAKGG